MEVDDDQVSMQREELARTREQHQGSLERMFEKISNEETFGMLSSAELRVYQERLNRHFDLFEETDLEYRRQCILITNELFTEIERQYMAAMAKINDRLTEQNSFAQISSSTPARGPEVSLPTVIKVEAVREPQIGTFNGNAADWPSFRDLFIAEVHNKPIEAVNKLLYLQKACVEKAAATLGPWRPTSENYAIAWDILKNVYDDNYHVIHGILGRMHSVPKQGQETHDALRAIVDSLNSGTRQLETIASPEVLWDQVWIHHAKQRLPKSTLDSWEQYRNRDGNTMLPRLEEFKRFLEVKAKGRREYETGDQNARSEPRQEVEKFSQAKFSQERPGREQFRRERLSRDYRNQTENRRYPNFRPQPYGRSDRYSQHRPSQAYEKAPQNNNTERALVEPDRCPMDGCVQKHPVFMCEKFKAAGLEDRWNVVKKNRLCRCCLKPGHGAATCTYATCGQCPDDTNKHNFRLCKKAKHNQGGDKSAQTGNPFARPSGTGAQ